MVQLILDTSGPWCAVMLMDPTDGEAVAERRARLERGHDQALAPMVKDVLAAARRRPADVGRVVACVGPGSFAGVRVGVAFARGFARALGVEAVGASALDAWALSAAVDGAGVSAGVHDARRGEVVWRAFRDGAPAGAAVTEPREVACAALDAAGAGGPVRLAGSGAALLAGGARIDTGVRAVDLAVLAAVAAADPQPARPFYHRPPDAVPSRAMATTLGDAQRTAG